MRPWSPPRVACRRRPAVRAVPGLVGSSSPRRHQLRSRLTPDPQFHIELYFRTSFVKYDGTDRTEDESSSTSSCRRWPCSSNAKENSQGRRVRAASAPRLLPGAIADRGRREGRQVVQAPRLRADQKKIAPWNHHGWVFSAAVPCTPLPDHRPPGDAARRADSSPAVRAMSQRACHTLLLYELLPHMPARASSTAGDARMRAQ